MRHAINADQLPDTTWDPVWKVCIVRPRSRPRSFGVPYIFYSKFLKSRARNLQTFQSGMGLRHEIYCID